MTIKSSALQILPETRKALVGRLVPALLAAWPGLIAERVSSMFEEMPVENIAIGTHISVFGRKSQPGQGVARVPDWDTSVGPTPH